MTTAVQVRRAVKPLLERHFDLALVDGWIVLRPVRHLVRAILIDRTGRADDFRVKWCVMHLFEVRSSIFLNWGHELYFPDKGLWQWSRPEAVPALRDVIEQELPRLREIMTIFDLMEQLRSLWPGAGALRPGHRHPINSWPETKLIFDVALGDLEIARQLCRERIPIPEKHARDAEDRAQLARLKELCRRLAADDRAGLAALLHEWEAATVKNLKLEHQWEQTPFPLEQA